MHGWDAEGIDADPSTEPFHRELGISSRIGQLEQLEIGKEYDVIHIAHAIYFVTNPMNFLRMVRERLAPEGLFCIVLADFMASVDPALPSYVHTFFRPRHQCVMRFRSPDSKRYSVGAYREAYSWLPARCRPRPGRSLAQ